MLAQFWSVQSCNGLRPCAAVHPPPNHIARPLRPCARMTRCFCAFALLMLGTRRSISANSRTGEPSTGPPVVVWGCRITEDRQPFWKVTQFGFNVFDIYIFSLRITTHGYNILKHRDWITISHQRTSPSTTMSLSEPPDPRSWNNNITCYQGQ
jgi:hypothetical protein